MKIFFILFIFFSLCLSCRNSDTNFFGSYNQIDIVIKNNTNVTLKGGKIYFKNNFLPILDEILIDLKPFEEIKFSYNLEHLQTLSEGSAYISLINYKVDTYLFFFENRGSYNNNINVQIMDDNVVVKEKRIIK